ncbi:MAG: septum formation initiator family protein [Myxococcota bacterium]
MKLQHGVAAVVAASIFVFGYTLFGSSALPRYWSMHDKKISLQTRVAFLEARILEQKQKIGLLAGHSARSEAVIEQIARREYGFVGKKESLLILH